MDGGATKRADEEEMSVVGVVGGVRWATWFRRRETDEKARKRGGDKLRT